MDETSNDLKILISKTGAFLKTLRTDKSYNPSFIFQWKEFEELCVEIDYLMLREVKPTETEINDRFKELEAGDNELVENKGVSLIDLSSGEKLLLVLSDHEAKLEKMADEVHTVLNTSSNSAKLVLDSVTKGVNGMRKGFGSDIERSIVNKSCVMLLEELMRLKPGISKRMRKRAGVVAKEWKEMIDEKNEKNENDVMEVLGFMVLLSAYGLVDMFDLAEIRKLFEIVAQHKLAPELEEVLGLVDKIHESIDTEVPFEQAPCSTSLHPSWWRELNSLCINMDGNGLVSFLCQHMKDHESMRQPLSDALELASDPAKLVLDVLPGFLIDKFIKEILLENFRVSCILLLEQMKPVFLLAKESLNTEALKLAFAWKTEVSQTYATSMTAYGFWQFIEKFNLASNFGEHDLLEVFFKASKLKETSKLSLDPGLADTTIKSIITKEPIEKTSLIASSPQNCWPELKSLCIQMDGKGLVLFLSKHVQDHESMRQAISDSLELSSDSGKLVLDVLPGFLHNQLFKTLELPNVRRSCIILLEQMKPVFPLKPRGMKRKALKLAVDWKAKVDEAYSTSVTAYGFLQFIVTYNLVSSFDACDFLAFFVKASRHRQSPKLFLSLGLADKTTVLINNLLQNALMLEAMEYICAFELLHKCSPQRILNGYLNYQQRKIHKGEKSCLPQNEAIDREIVAIRAVIKCISDHKLESHCPLNKFEKQIVELEKRKTYTTSSTQNEAQNEEKKTKEKQTSKQTEKKETNGKQTNEVTVSQEGIEQAPLQESQVNLVPQIESISFEVWTVKTPLQEIQVKTVSNCADTASNLSESIPCKVRTESAPQYEIHTMPAPESPISTFLKSVPSELCTQIAPQRETEVTSAASSAYFTSESIPSNEWIEKATQSETQEKPVPLGANCTKKAPQQETKGMSAASSAVSTFLESIPSKVFSEKAPKNETQVKPAPDSAICTHLESIPNKVCTEKAPQLETEVKPAPNSVISTALDSINSKAWTEKAPQKEKQEKPAQTSKLSLDPGLADTTIKSIITEEPIEKTSLNASSPLKCWPELKSLCIKMDGKGLVSFLSKHVQDLDSMRHAISDSLESSSDPGIFVLDVLPGFLHNQFFKTLHLQDVRSSCIILLEQMKPVFPLKQRGMNKKSLKLAVDWKAKVDQAYSSSVTAYGFLQFIVTYNLVSSFDACDFLAVFVKASGYKQSPKLFLALGLADKTTVLINNLLQNTLMLEAVEYICAFELLHEFPPQRILNGYLKYQKRKIHKGEKSCLPQNEAIDREIAAIRAVIKCISDHKLEPHCPLNKFEKQIVELEKRKTYTTSSSLKEEKKTKEKQTNKQTEKKKTNGKQTNEVSVSQVWIEQAPTQENQVNLMSQIEGIPSEVWTVEAPLQEIQVKTMSNCAGTASNLSESIPYKVRTESAPQQETHTTPAPQSPITTFLKSVPSQICTHIAPQRETEVTPAASSARLEKAPQSETEKKPAPLGGTCTEKAPQQETEVISAASSAVSTVLESILSKVWTEKAPQKETQVKPAPGSAICTHLESIPSKVCAEKAPQGETGVKPAPNSVISTVLDTIHSKVWTEKAPQKEKQEKPAQYNANCTLAESVPSKVCAEKAPQQEKEAKPAPCIESIPSKLWTEKAPLQETQVRPALHSGVCTLSESFPFKVCGEKTLQRETEVKPAPETAISTVFESIPSNVWTEKPPQQEAQMKPASHSSICTLSEGIPSKVCAENAPQQVKQVKPSARIVIFPSKVWTEKGPQQERQVKPAKNIVSIPSKVSTEKAHRQETQVKPAPHSAIYTLSESIPSEVCAEKAPQQEKKVKPAAHKVSIPSMVWTEKAPQQEPQMKLAPCSGISESIPSKVCGEKSQQWETEVKHVPYSSISTVLVSIPSRVGTEKTPQKETQLNPAPGSAVCTHLESIPSKICAEKAAQQEKEVESAPHIKDPLPEIGLKPVPRSPSKVCTESAPHQETHVTPVPHSTSSTMLYNIPCEVGTEKSPQEGTQVKPAPHVTISSLLERICSKFWTVKAPQKETQVKPAPNSTASTFTESIPCNVWTEEAPQQKIQVKHVPNIPVYTLLESIPFNLCAQKVPQQEPQLKPTPHSVDIYAVLEGITSKACTENARQKEPQVKPVQHNASSTLLENLFSNVLTEERLQKMKGKPTQPNTSSSPSCWPELKSYCISMDGKKLLLFLCQHVEDHDSMRQAVSYSLKLAPNSAKLVLDILPSFLYSNKDFEEFSTHTVRVSCVLLLEQLYKLSLYVNFSMNEDAMKLAVDWKTRVTKNQTFITAYGLLLFVMTYKLVSTSDAYELFGLVARTIEHKQSPGLNLPIGLTEKIPGEKWIKYYSSKNRILLVGDGDFSFSLCLAKAFGSAANMTATSLDSRVEVTTKYSKATANLKKLEELGCTILHGVNVLTMTKHNLLYLKPFDRIVFNFPHAGFRLPEVYSLQIMHHQKVIKGFLRSARDLLHEKGEVHITHKTTNPFNLWNIDKLAEEVGLSLVEKVPFCIADYPGYHNKRGAGIACDNAFPVGEAATFKFSKPLR